jgi:hypothetical protein
VTKRKLFSLMQHRISVGSQGCWLWCGSMFDSGYGRVTPTEAILLGSQSTRAHVAFWVAVNGSTRGLFVCHSCDVKRCCNPSHGWLGTNQDNQKDAVSKGNVALMWTPERRARWSKMSSGADNPMYGRTGDLAPASGRVGSKHPMFGKHHSEASKRKTSETLRRKNAAKRF